MDHPLIDLINARIAAAEADGAFENLAGAGKPLPLDNTETSDPITGLLKRNGAVPEAVQVARTLAALRDDLLETADRTARARLLTEIAVLQGRLELLSRHR